jgi:hypothetical protein
VYSPRPISGAAVYGQSDAQPLWPLFAAPAYTQITATAHADYHRFWDELRFFLLSLNASSRGQISGMNADFLVSGPAIAEISTLALLLATKPASREGYADLQYRNHREGASSGLDNQELSYRLQTEWSQRQVGWREVKPCLPAQTASCSLSPVTCTLFTWPRLLQLPPSLSRRRCSG